MAPGKPDVSEPEIVAGRAELERNGRTVRESLLDRVECRFKRRTVEVRELVLRDAHRNKLLKALPETWAGKENRWMHLLNVRTELCQVFARLSWDDVHSECKAQEKMIIQLQIRPRIE